MSKNLNKILFSLLLAAANRIIITLAPFIASGRKVIPYLFNPEIFKQTVYSNLNRYDAGWYEQIAQWGYLTPKSSAFFPLYPLLIRGLSMVSGLSYKACGTVISIVCFVIALCLIQSLAEKDDILRNDHAKEKAGRWIACIAALSPVSFYYSICYTESLFFMLALLFMITVSDRKWLLAGITGFFAGMTRNSGVFLAIIFFFEYFRSILPEYRDKSPAKRFKLYVADFLGLVCNFKLQCFRKYSSFFNILLIPGGTLLYFVYLFSRFGSFSSALSAVDQFGRSSLAPWLTLGRGFQHNVFKIIFTRDSYIFYYYLLELLAVLIFFFAAVFLIGRMPASYNLFMAASLILPLCKPAYTGWVDYFVSFPRYAAVLFPYFAALYMVFRNSRKTFIFYLAFSSYLLIRLVSFWSAGMFIS